MNNIMFLAEHYYRECGLTSESCSLCRSYERAQSANSSYDEAMYNGNHAEADNIMAQFESDFGIYDEDEAGAVRTNP